jgi:pantoate--beta-alanine ligase
MIILKKAGDIKLFISDTKEKGMSTGFVPTMGALHPGHISLITKAKTETDQVVCSIFVNPTQFNDPGDFEKYPVTIEQDIYQLEKAGCDILFLPVVDEMYPTGSKNNRHFELGFLDTILEAKFRPGHFQGVCQVVVRLLEIIFPEKLYLGQKDFQQCMVIKKMAKANYPSLQIVICPIQRERDGLAMSSRNMRLPGTERKQAAKISAALELVKKNISAGDVRELRLHTAQYLNSNGFKVDYVEIADANTLELLDFWNGNQVIVILIAAFLNDVRLIDNMIVGDYHSN